MKMKKLIILSLVFISYSLFANDFGLSFDLKINRLANTRTVDGKEEWNYESYVNSNFGGKLYYFFNNGIDVFLGGGYGYLYTEKDPFDITDDSLSGADNLYLITGVDYIFSKNDLIDVGFGFSFTHNKYNGSLYKDFFNYTLPNAQSSSAGWSELDFYFPLFIDLKINKHVFSRISTNLLIIEYYIENSTSNYEGVDMDHVRIDNLYFDTIVKDPEIVLSVVLKF